MVSLQLSSAFVQDLFHRTGPAGAALLRVLLSAVLLSIIARPSPVLFWSHWRLLLPYDAVLLAEYVSPARDQLRALMRPELARTLDHFVDTDLLALTVNWPNFRDEYPTMSGEAAPWLRRLAAALSAA